MKFGFYSQMQDSPIKRDYADLLDELREQVVFLRPSRVRYRLG